MMHRSRTCNPVRAFRIYDMTTKSAILRQNAANCAELAAAVEKEPAKNRSKKSLL